MRHGDGSGGGGDQLVLAKLYAQTHTQSLFVRCIFAGIIMNCSLRVDHVRLIRMFMHAPKFDFNETSLLLHMLNIHVVPASYWNTLAGRTLSSFPLRA